MTDAGPVLSAWVVRPLPRSDARLRLFCIPYAGGGTTAFRGWAERLPATVDVCLIRAPGRERRLNETPYRRMRPLVAALTEAIGPLLDRPFVLFGHSLGGLIAFESVHRLEDAGWSAPAHLLVSACRAPQLPSSQPPLHELPEAAFRERLRQLGGTPGEVLDDPEMMALFDPLLRADFAVAETYEYRERGPLGCPITAFAAERDERARLAEVEGWTAQTTAEFNLRVLPGDHFFLHARRDALLGAIRDALGPHLSATSAGQP